jgi:hypothetical protein
VTVPSTFRDVSISAVPVTLRFASTVTLPLKVPPEAALTVSEAWKMLRAKTSTTSEAVRAARPVMLVPVVAVKSAPLMSLAPFR